MAADRSKRRNTGKAKGGEATLPDLRALESFLSEIAGGPDDDGLAAAQEIMYDAWDAGTSRRRIALARKALAVSHLCADAYVLLAQEEARTPEAARDLYRQGMQAGERALGEAAFIEDVGYFWGLLETRPYMRARHGLAQVSWTLGDREEAVAHYQDMLRLNPNDNQGIRYTLLACLLELGRDAEAGTLLKRYKDDGAAGWLWSAALWRYRRDGKVKAARTALGRAMESNRHVPAYLLGQKRMPKELPAWMAMGSEDEAVVYVHEAGNAWAATPAALPWLAEALGTVPEHPQRIGRHR